MAGSTEWRVAWIPVVTPPNAWPDVSGAGGAGAAAALTEVLLESEAMPEMIPEAIPDANIGDALAQSIIQGNIVGEGTIVLPVRYEGMERFLTLFMADQSFVAGGTDIGETVGTARNHIMVFQPSNTGFFGTLVIDKSLDGTIVWEYSAAKISQINLTHNNGKLMFTPTLIPTHCERESVINTDTELDLITPPTTTLLALFNHLIVRIAEVTGSEGNLLAADDICVTNATLNVNRNLTGIPDSCNAGEVGEPETDGLPEGTLVLSIADYGPTIDAIILEAQKRQPGSEPKNFKAQLIWVGKDITGSDSATGRGTGGINTYEVVVELPSLQVSAAPANAGGPGARVPVEVTFQITTPTVAGNGTEWTWSTAGTDPFRIRNINESELDFSV